MRQAVFRFNPSALAVPNGDVVNHGIKLAQSIRLLCNTTHLSNRCDITDKHGLSSARAAHRVLCPQLIARMKHDLMALLDQQLTSHQPQPVGRTGDEYA